MAKQSYIISWASTEVGIERENNEDAFLNRPDIGLFAVSDGMGGMPKGEVASWSAIEKLEQIFNEHETEMGFMFDWPAGCFTKRKVYQLKQVIDHTLRETLAALNQEVRRQQRVYGVEMGATMSILWLVHQWAFVAHTGDSSIFRRRRNGRVKKLTTDHVSGKYLDAGLGLYEVVRGEVHGHIRKQGDVYLVCSDGVTTHLKEKEIARFVGGHHLPDVPRAITLECLERGGLDNITMVLAQDLSP